MAAYPIPAQTATGIEFDALPYAEGRRWELLEGELIPVSSPTLKHQEIVFRVLAPLKSPGEMRALHRMMSSLRWMLIRGCAPTCGLC